VGCASASLCVAFGYNLACGGMPYFCAQDAPLEVASTTDPTGGVTSWHSVATQDPTAVVSVSCPSLRLCVAVGNSGQVVMSTDPTGAGSAWSVVDVDSTSALTAVSCPTTKLCLAVDSSGNVLWSTQPTGPASSWSSAHISSHWLTGIACPATSMCIAIDGAGNAYTATSPASGATAWTPAVIDNINTVNALTAITCPDVLVCVAVDGAGDTVVGHGPTAPEIRRARSRQLGAPNRRVIRRLLRHHTYATLVHAPTAGQLSVQWYGITHQHHSRRRELLIASGTATLATGQTARIVLRSTPEGRTLLKHHRPRIAAHTRFTPVGGEPLTTVTTSPTD
jgi:hypothetical protein